MTEKQVKTVDLTSFTNAYKDMIATNESAYNSSGLLGSRKRRDRVKKYSLEEIQRIIESDSIDAQITLSRNYFSRDGIYRRIIIHYATLLNYNGILIPNPSKGKSLQQDFVQKKYYQAIEFADKLDIPSMCSDIAIKALRDGCYYGIIQAIDKKGVSILDLPVKYCVSRFKDKIGNDIIEFDTKYFDSITDEEARRGALRVYPKVITNWYRRYKNGKVKTSWVYIPTNISICLPFLDSRPNFLGIISDIVEYDEAVEDDRERDAEEIRKIIVQKIPHLQDGTLLFEPQEAKVMHDGAARMMRDNKNISVLTTYGDIDAIVSKTARDNGVNAITKSLENVYSETGVSKQLFGSDSNLALESSINNDMAMMMVFAHKLSKLFSFLINSVCANANIDFSFKILPITHYNATKFIETTFKLATSGYSFILPILGLGISQKEIMNIKQLENDLLKMQDYLIPLESAYTQSGEVGRPKKDNPDKADKTIANEESLDNNGGSE